MKVLSAEFVTSATGAPTGIAADAPQVALAGRSNVGKSSLINALCRRRIARTSAAPGKTRLVNIYRVRLEATGLRELYLVDLPAYGYARGGEDSARELQAVAEAYFAPRECLRPERPFDGAQGRPQIVEGRGSEGGEPSAAPSANARVASRGGGVPRPGEMRPASTEKTRHALLLVDSRHPGLDSDIDAARWLVTAGVEPHLVATKIDKLSRSERARNLKALGDIFGTAALPVSAQSGEGLNELWQLIIRLAKNR